MEKEKEYYDIYSNASLLTLIDKDGLINSDICIKPSNTKEKFDKVEGALKL